MHDAPSPHRPRPRAAGAFWAAVVAMAGVLILVIGASVRPLWYDEFFTYYVSRLPGPGAIAQALLEGADNGPPFDYWLRNSSMSLFGSSPLALRLPSIAGLLVSAWALAATVRPRQGAAAAWIAVLGLGFTVAPRYGIEARAYSTLLACMAVALWAWQSAVMRPDRRRYAVVLGLALFLSPMTHYYGVLNYLPILAAEVASWGRAPRCGRRWAALVLSLGSVGFLPAFARHAWQMRQHFWAAARNPWSVVDAYSSLFGLGLAFLVFVGVLWFRTRPRSQSAPRSQGDPARRGIAAATGVLLLTPVIVYGMASAFTNAMAHRYALITTLGLALVAALLGAPFAAARPRWTRALIAVLVVVQLASWERQLLGDGAGSDVEGIRTFLGGHAEDLVVEDAQDFLRLYHDLPLREGRQLVYLSDAELSVQHLGYDTDEIALPKLRPYARFHLVDFEAYLRRQSDFLVIVGPEPRWLSSELQLRHYELDLVARVGSHTVYRVRPPAAAR